MNVFGYSAAGFLLLSGALAAAETDLPALPQPLTLEAAWSLAEQNHPELQILQAAQQDAAATRDLADAQDNLHIHLKGALGWINPADSAPDQSAEDHWASLEISRTLWDFGRSSAATRAAQLHLEAADQQLMEAKQQQRLTLMQRFFAVLLADLQFRVDTETMAIAYVEYDKLKERRTLGQRSDLETAEAEAHYQKILQQRRRSEMQQRLTRAALANSLNHSGELPENLVKPTLTAWQQRPLPELEKLQKQSVEDNFQLKALRQQLAAAQAQLQAVRAERAPILSAHLEANYWQRELGSRDPHRAMLNIEIPLYQGGKVAAQIAQAQAELDRLQAELAVKQMAVRQAVLEAWMQLQTLTAQHEEIEAQAKWREMQLDRNRTLYELEFSTDFGDALVNQSSVELMRAQNEYAVVLQWITLDALSGQTISLQPIVP